LIRLPAGPSGRVQPANVKAAASFGPRRETAVGDSGWDEPRAPGWLRPRQGKPRLWQV